MQSVTDQYGNRVYIDEDGNQYISTTTLLSRYENKDGLNAWIKRVGVKEANSITSQSVSIGNEAHLAIEEFSDGRKTIEDITSVHARAAIDSFYRYTTPVIQEQQFLSKRGYAGRIDQVVSISDSPFRIACSGSSVPDGTYLVDLKTKRSQVRTDTAERTLKHCLQLAAYWQLLKDNGIDIDGAFLICVTVRRSAKVTNLYLNRNKILFYLEWFNLLLQDYLGEMNKPLPSDIWDTISNRATLSYNRYTGDFVDYLPEIVL